MMRPEAGDPDPSTGASNYRRPRMDEVSGRLGNDPPFSFHPPSLADPLAVSQEQTFGSHGIDGGSSNDDAFGGVGV